MEKRLLLRHFSHLLSAFKVLFLWFSILKYTLRRKSFAFGHRLQEIHFQTDLIPTFSALRIILVLNF